MAMKFVEKSIDSREVSDMVNKQHKELLRDVRKYIPVLTGANLRSLDYFIPSEYLDQKNQPRPCYLITKIGCDLVGNKLQGSKGIEFTAKYVKRFEEMSNHIVKTESSTSIKVQLQALLLHEEQLETLTTDVTMLKQEIDLSRLQKKKLSDLVKRNVMSAVGGKHTQAYGALYKVAISEHWREIKNYFCVASYEEIPKIRFAEAMKLAGLWNPSAELKMRIDETNSQQSLALA